MKTEPSAVGGRREQRIFIYEASVRRRRKAGTLSMSKKSIITSFLVKIWTVCDI
jgi:hypothetical protein